MKYRAVCKLHPEFESEEREAYADALADLAAHQDAAHFVGVVTIEPPAAD